MRVKAIVATSCVLGVVAGAFLVHEAASQPRGVTTRQLQIVGAAANNQSHGAWLIDLQSQNVIFCERTSSGVQCHSTALPP